MLLVGRKGVVERGLGGGGESGKGGNGGGRGEVSPASVFGPSGKLSRG